MCIRDRLCPPAIHVFNYKGEMLEAGFGLLSQGLHTQWARMHALHMLVCQVAGAPPPSLDEPGCPAWGSEGVAQL
eukprot:7607774-Alexandrium_andersonii.AAC.1